jgi:hypothetical protein
MAAMATEARRNNEMALLMRRRSMAVVYRRASVAVRLSRAAPPTLNKHKEFDREGL